ncbi:TRAP transporter small permease [Jannaschia donghaensis]|uniref:TRAP transporter small permease protein n=1 Tax=Jannaschia donghaensis TaxID=420998 RepID=A0A0M6YFU8_9RHOB|nr:TRAP transporter small permease [Jannaschia donghaensis]CTQ49231.1 2,3-diketo-L-gulonate TRAP transporter small permease protein YiaM [Jannaschia donghaensis]
MSDISDPPILLRRMDAAFDAIAMACRILTGLSLVTLTAIFGWLVYGRYVLNATPTWVEQVALLLVMVIAFLGAAVGVHDHTHLSVTMLRTAVPDRIRSVLVVVTDLFMAGFGLLMLWYGVKLTIFKWGSLIPLLDLPEGLRSVPLTVGGGLIALFSIGHLVRRAVGRDIRRDSIE